MSQNLFVPEISGVSNATLQPYLAMLGGNTGLEAVGELTEALANTPSYELAVEHLKQDPRSAALIEERYMSPPTISKPCYGFPQKRSGMFTLRP
jgi:ubiquinone biosynthesis protein Coq4